MITIKFIKFQVKYIKCVVLYYATVNMVMKAFMIHLYKLKKFSGNIYLSQKAIIITYDVP